jgi:hypothetical protein
MTGISGKLSIIMGKSSSPEMNGMIRSKRMTSILLFEMSDMASLASWHNKILFMPADMSVILKPLRESISSSTSRIGLWGKSDCSIVFAFIVIFLVMIALVYWTGSFPH